MRHNDDNNNKTHFISHFPHCSLPLTAICAISHLLFSFYLSSLSHSLCGFQLLTPYQTNMILPKVRSFFMCSEILKTNKQSINQSICLHPNWCISLSYLSIQKHTHASPSPHSASCLPFARAKAGTLVTINSNAD